MKPYYQDDNVGITIYHADCREVLPALMGRSVDLCFADPPFNAGKVYASGLHNDKMVTAAYLDWLRDWIQLLPATMVPGGTVWLMNETRWIGHCQTLLTEMGFTFLNMVAWVYTNPTPCRKRYAKTWRPILVYCEGDTPRTWHGNARPLKRATLYYNPDRARTAFCHDVWPDIPKLVGGIFAPPELITEPNGQFSHIAQMPIAISDRVMATATEPGNTVLDPFMGSGTTLRAAKDLGRKAIGIEIEERYCEIAVQRLQQEVLPL